MFDLTKINFVSMFGIRCSKLGITQHRTSNYEYQTPNIEHRTSSHKHQTPKFGKMMRLF